MGEAKRRPPDPQDHIRDHIELLVDLEDCPAHPSWHALEHQVAQQEDPPLLMGA